MACHKYKLPTTALEVTAPTMHNHKNGTNCSRLDPDVAFYFFIYIFFELVWCSAWRLLSHDDC